MYGHRRPCSLLGPRPPTDALRRVGRLSRGTRALTAASSVRGPDALATFRSRQRNASNRFYRRRPHLPVPPSPHKPPLSGSDLSRLQTRAVCAVASAMKAAGGYFTDTFRCGARARRRPAGAHSDDPQSSRRGPWTRWPRWQPRPPLRGMRHRGTHRVSFGRARRGPRRLAAVCCRMLHSMCPAAFKASRDHWSGVNATLRTSSRIMPPAPLSPRLVGRVVRKVEALTYPCTQ